VWRSAVILAKRPCRDGDGICASGHHGGPPGVSIHFVHWWSGSNAVEVGGGMADCGIMYGEEVGTAVGWYVEEWGVWMERR
jgi:hypothetical protein